jgi:hypothetical protein
MGPVPVVPGNSSSTRTPGSELGISDKIGVGVGVVGLLFAGVGITLAMKQMWKQKFGDEKPTSTSRAK